MSDMGLTQTVEIKLTDNMRTAVDHAFEQAREILEEDGRLPAFSILCTSDGFDVHEHPGDAPDQVYESMKALVAREMPEAYVFAYDGFVETDEGTVDAVLCEVARRGDIKGYLLALPYDVTPDGYSFDENYLSAGSVTPLYPRGTKPIVSGLIALEEERRRQAD